MERSRLSMNNTSYKYISNIFFSDLYNWSVQYAKKSESTFRKLYPQVKIGTFLTRVKNAVNINDNQSYKRVSIKLYNGGIVLRDIEKGSNIGTKKQFIIKTGEFLLSKIDARNGAVGIVPDSCDGAIITGNFWSFKIDSDLIKPEFLTLLATTKYFTKIFDSASNGTTNRHYLQEDLFLNIEIPLPTIEKQREIVEEYNKLCQTAVNLKKQAVGILEEFSSIFKFKLGIQTNANEASKVGFRTIPFSKITKWSIAELSKSQTYLFGKSKFECRNVKDLISQMSGGKTPSTGNSAYWQEGDVCWTSAKDMKDLFLKATEDHITKAAVHENSLTIHQPGTILAVFRSGILRHSFPIAISTVPTTINQDLKAIKLNNDLILDKYFLFYFYFMQKLVLESAMKTGVTVESIDVDAFLKIPVVVPPLTEQQNIIAQIDKIMQKIQDLKSKADIIKIEAQQQFEKELFE